MPSIILKKTFKTKSSGNEKAFSLHGISADDRLVGILNEALNMIKCSHSATRLQFERNDVGHYYAPMNHDFQKYHEEDAMSIILDSMEGIGWTFNMQWDTTMGSADGYDWTGSGGGGSKTSRELFLFQRPLAAE